MLLFLLINFTYEWISSLSVAGNDVFTNKCDEGFVISSKVLFYNTEYSEQYKYSSSLVQCYPHLDFDPSVLKLRILCIHITFIFLWAIPGVIQSISCIFFICSFTSSIIIYFFLRMSKYTNIKYIYLSIIILWFTLFVRIYTATFIF